MSDVIVDNRQRWPPLYQGWINLIFAVLASVVALPCMTWGLGIVTEPLLKDIEISRETWAGYNFWATVVAGVFLLPIGLVIDRFGARPVAVVSTFILSVSVWFISRADTGGELQSAMIAARCAGQGVLAVASVAFVGKWFARRITMAMTIYGVAVILAFMLAERITGEMSASLGWRSTWERWSLFSGLIVCPLLAFFVRSTPTKNTRFAEGEMIAASVSAQSNTVSEAGREFTLAAAAATPIFWVFCLAGAANGGSQAVVSLFGISILRLNGFSDPLATFLRAVAVVSSIGAILGLLGTGVLCRTMSQKGILRVACMLGIASSMVLPVASTPIHADMFGASWGLQCGVLTVVTNTVWVKYYGRKHQGAIEGFTMFVQLAAQAGAPWLMTQLGSDKFGPAVFFYALAGLFGLLFLASLVISASESDTK